MRSLPEWIGKNDDSPIPDRVRLRIFLQADGKCQVCARKLAPPADKWICDHILALINGGQNRESNLQVICEWCNKDKTPRDTAVKALTYRKRKAHLGIKPRGKPMPGTRRSKWKKKLDGTVVKR